jgi:hypothetical protein
VGATVGLVREGPGQPLKQGRTVGWPATTKLFAEGADIDLTAPAAAEPFEEVFDLKDGGGGEAGGGVETGDLEAGAEFGGEAHVFEAAVGGAGAQGFGVEPFDLGGKAAGPTFVQARGQFGQLSPEGGIHTEAGTDLILENLAEVDQLGAGAEAEAFRGSDGAFGEGQAGEGRVGGGAVEGGGEFAGFAPTMGHQKSTKTGQKGGGVGGTLGAVAVKGGREKGDGVFGIGGIKMAAFGAVGAGFVAFQGKTREGIKKDQGQRISVGGGVPATPFENLGVAPTFGAYADLGVGRPGEGEVKEGKWGRLGKRAADIVGFDVAVEDIVVVEVIEGGEDMLGKGFEFRAREATRSAEAFTKGGPAKAKGQGGTGVVG